MKHLFTLIFAITFSLLYVTNAYSQCPAPVNEGDFACAGTVAANGTPVNNTEIHYFSGGPTTFASQFIVEDGGTLIVCGDLTLNGGLNLKTTGKVIVKSTGKLTINTHTIDGTIHNFGELLFSGNLVVNNGQIYNASTTSELTVSGNSTFNTTNDFVNKGSATFSGNVHTNGSATVCLDAGSIASIAGTWANDANNGWSAPSGDACVSYSNAANIAWGANNLTSTAALKICRTTGAGTISGQGSAVVTADCSSCGSLLPIELSKFTMQRNIFNSKYVDFYWVTESEDDNDYFTVEYSINGIDFKPLVTEPSQGSGSSELEYSTNALVPEASIIYFRLKQTDFNSKSTYSKVVSFYDTKETSFCAVSSITEDNVQLLFDNYTKTEIEVIVYSVAGSVLEIFTTTDTEMTISRSNLPETCIILVKKENLVFTKLIQ